MQRPLRQPSALQQEVSSVQAWPSGLQVATHRPATAFVIQKNAEQHGALAPQSPCSWLQPGAQVPSDVTPASVLGGRHDKPSQQSALVSQPCPLTLQRGGPQILPLQRPPQHSLSEAQAAPSARQPNAHTPPWQARLVQQSASERHARPRGVQAHCPTKQLKEQQSSALVQAPRDKQLLGVGFGESPQLTAVSNRSAASTEPARPIIDASLLKSSMSPE
jgi:hypothetical protein